MMDVTDKITGEWIANPYRIAANERRGGNPYKSNSVLRMPIDRSKLPALFDTRPDSYFNTSLDNEDKKHLTLYESRVRNMAQIIGVWSANIQDAGISPDNAHFLNERKSQLAQELYTELFSVFNFTSDERDKVKGMILSEISELLNFNGTYEIEEGKSNLLTLLNGLGGFGTYTEAQAKDMARNASALRLAKSKGKKSIDELTIVDVKRKCIFL